MMVRKLACPPPNTASIPFHAQYVSIVVAPCFPVVSSSPSTAANCACPLNRANWLLCSSGQKGGWGEGGTILGARPLVFFVGGGRWIGLLYCIRGVRLRSP